MANRYPTTDAHPLRLLNVGYFMQVGAYNVWRPRFCKLVLLAKDEAIPVRGKTYAETVRKALKVIEARSA
jgi:hypothetical protein